MNQRCRFASNTAMQWLDIRLQMIGVAVVTAIAGIAIIQHQRKLGDPGELWNYYGLCRMHHRLCHPCPLSLLSLAQNIVPFIGIRYGFWIFLLSLKKE